MNSPTKNILAIHDLSCFGRCALTVIIPTISVMGHQVTPLPSALLSTHTGGFENMEFRDLTDTLIKNFDHMLYSGAKFDAVYPGFLGSVEQIDIVSDILKRAVAAIKFVDPVMGDNGIPYQTYTEEMCTHMHKLCHGADVITPNATEAAFLLGESYVDTSDSDISTARTQTEKLCCMLYKKFSNKYIALTGVECTENGKKYVCTATSENGMFDFTTTEQVGTSYPGTGDVFASVLLGNMLNGVSFKESVRRAACFIEETVSYTYSCGTPVRNGILLEKNLYKLLKGTV